MGVIYNSKCFGASDVNVNLALLHERGPTHGAR